jgi:hypothetical protein
MNYPKIVLLAALALIATACGNDKTPNALSPSAPPASTSPAAPATSPTDATPTSTVAPLPGAPPLVPGTIPTSGVNPPGTSAGNIQNGSNDDSPPRRKKARVKKVTEPSPKVTYYDTPAKGKPGSKPAKSVKEPDGEGVSDEEVKEKPRKSPAKPVKKPKNTSDESSDEKEPAAKPAKPPKAEVDGAEGKKTKLPKAEADGAEGKKSKPADPDGKN